MKLTHKGPAKQEVRSTISFTEEDVINALQEFASKRGIQCPPGLEYTLIVDSDSTGYPRYKSEWFIELRACRDGVANPIYESLQAIKPEPSDPPRPIGGIHEVA